MLYGIWWLYFPCFVLFFSDRQWHFFPFPFSHFLNASATCFTLVTSRAEGKGRMDPEAPQFCRRRGRPCLSRGAGDLRYLPRPTHPSGRPLLCGPGAPAGRRLLGPRVRAGDPQGTLREPEAPAARLTVGGRPPSLSGRRAASLGGGEEGAGAPASASRSSPAHRSSLARARAAPAVLLPSPHLRLSRWRARRHPSP